MTQMEVAERLDDIDQMDKAEMQSKPVLDRDVVNSHYTSKSDYTTYGAGTYSNDGRDSKMPSGSITRVANKLCELSEEAYRIIIREAEARDMSILDVILEKARDRVIQPDVLDEIEQKAVEDT